MDSYNYCTVIADIIKEERSNLDNIQLANILKGLVKIYQPSSLPSLEEQESILLTINSEGREYTRKPVNILTEGTLDIISDNFYRKLYKLLKQQKKLKACSIYMSNITYQSIKRKTHEDFSISIPYFKTLIPVIIDSNILTDFELRDLIYE